MYLSIFVLVAVAAFELIGSSVISNTTRVTGRGRSPKLFPLLGFVRFPNTNCTVNADTGICLTQKECSRSAGVSLGRCAYGYGVCCLYRRSCGDITKERIVSFVNPSYPSFDKNNGMCILTLNPASSNTCQIRFEFVQLDLEQPVKGKCSPDENLEIFSNTASPLGISRFCGKLNRQHMYIHLDQYRDQRRSTIVPILRSLPRRQGHLWNIRIIQINCLENPESKGKQSEGESVGFLSEAPAGCLQYFTEMQGKITSFNYGGAMGSASYVQDQNYVICIRRSPNTRCIRYTTGSTEGIFLDKSETNCQRGDQTLDPSKNPTDFLWIPNSDATTPFCGSVEGFYKKNDQAPPVTEIKSKWKSKTACSSRSDSAPGPYYMRFVTDTTSDNDKGGFSINYKVTEDSSCK